MVKPLICLSLRLSGCWLLRAQEEAGTGNRWRALIRGTTLVDGRIDGPAGLRSERIIDSESSRRIYQRDNLPLACLYRTPEHPGCFGGRSSWQETSFVRAFLILRYLTGDGGGAVVLGK